MGYLYFLHNMGGWIGNPYLHTIHLKMTHSLFQVRSLWEGDWPGRNPGNGLSLYGLVKDICNICFLLAIACIIIFFSSEKSWQKCKFYKAFQYFVKLHKKVSNQYLDIIGLTPSWNSHVSILLQHYPLQFLIIEPIFEMVYCYWRNGSYFHSSSYL